MLTELLLHHIRDLMGAIRARASRFAAGCGDLHSDLNQFHVGVIQPRRYPLVRACPVLVERGNVRRLCRLGLDPQHSTNTISQVSVDCSPNIGFPIVVERQIKVGPEDSQSLKVFPVGFTSPFIVFRDPNARMAVGVKNFPEIRVQVFVTKERNYAALSNAVARRRRYSSIR